jgi:amino acid transporter
VFTPSILTILGLVLFLRMGFVIGYGGVLRSLAILGLATAISVTTSLSLAAIATNRKVRAGGDYYLISRSLGIATGGALARRLEESRIEAEVRSVVEPDLLRIEALCRDAALVFVPLRLPGMRPEDPFGLGLDALLERLPVSVLVAAAEDVPLSDDESEPEPAGAAAAAAPERSA